MEEQGSEELELLVLLPDSHSTTHLVHPLCPMMDLLIQIASRENLKVSAYVLEPLDATWEDQDFNDKPVIKCKPNTPIGTIHTQVVRLTPKYPAKVSSKNNNASKLSHCNSFSNRVDNFNKMSGTSAVPICNDPNGFTNLSQATRLVKSKSNYITSTLPPQVSGDWKGSSNFLNTFRLLVHLPQEQFHVIRASPEYTIQDILDIVHEERGLKLERYRVTKTNEPELLLDFTRTIKEYNITELTFELLPEYQRIADAPQPKKIKKGTGFGSSLKSFFRQLKPRSSRPSSAPSSRRASSMMDLTAPHTMPRPKTEISTNLQEKFAKPKPPPRKRGQAPPPPPHHASAAPPNTKLSPPSTRHSTIPEWEWSQEWETERGLTRRNKLAPVSASTSNLSLSHPRHLEPPQPTLRRPLSDLNLNKPKLAPRHKRTAPRPPSLPSVPADLEPSPEVVELSCIQEQEPPTDYQTQTEQPNTNIEPIISHCAIDNKPDNIELVEANPDKTETTSTIFTNIQEAITECDSTVKDITEDDSININDISKHNYVLETDITETMPYSAQNDILESKIILNENTDITPKNETESDSNFIIDSHKVMVHSVTLNNQAQKNYVKPDINGQNISETNEVFVGLKSENSDENVISSSSHVSNGELEIKTDSIESENLHKHAEIQTHTNFDNRLPESSPLSAIIPNRDKIPVDPVILAKVNVESIASNTASNHVAPEPPFFAKQLTESTSASRTVKPKASFKSQASLSTASKNSDSIIGKPTPEQLLKQIQLIQSKSKLKRSESVPVARAYNNIETVQVKPPKTNVQATTQETFRTDGVTVTTRYTYTKPNFKLASWADRNPQRTEEDKVIAESVVQMKPIESQQTGRSSAVKCDLPTVVDIIRKTEYAAKVHSVAQENGVAIVGAQYKATYEPKKSTSHKLNMKDINIVLPTLKPYVYPKRNSITEKRNHYEMIEKSNGLATNVSRKSSWELVTEAQSKFEQSKAVKEGSEMQDEGYVDKSPEESDSEAASAGDAPPYIIRPLKYFRLAAWNDGHDGCDDRAGRGGHGDTRGDPVDPPLITDMDEVGVVKTTAT